MTTPLLLVAISAVILAQLTIGIGVTLWRYRHADIVASVIAGKDIASVETGVWPGWREFRVDRTTFEDRGKSQRSLELVPVDGEPLPDFAPGQYLTVSFDLAALQAETARTIVRCYSLSDRPNAKTYRITVKRMPSPSARPDLPAGAASNHLHDAVREGDILRFKAPAGRFVFDTASDAPAVLLAGGIGITPLMSMLLWSLGHQPERRLHLFYGVRNSNDHAFKAELEALARSHPAFHLNVLYGEPGPDDMRGRDFQHIGSIDIELLKRILPHGHHLFYVCGPPAMMAALVPALATWGVPRADIHFESFGPASSSFAQPISSGAQMLLAVPFDIRFRQSGRTLAWTGEDTNLLDFAERHGIASESGCRSGSCGSCETRLVSGTIHYETKPDYEIAAGRCLLCVGTPNSALVLEA